MASLMGKSHLKREGKMTRNLRKNRALDAKAITSIRALALDEIEAANSGHPGMSLGAAAMLYQVYAYHMNYNPKNPSWLNRDRFVLSAGHASPLLYSILHHFGFDLPLEELKNFRQWGSKCPGHPEYGVTPGVEVSTGPLGQGISMAVGMAMAEEYLAAKFNTPDHKIFDHNIYVLTGDGCLMEGISHEACSLAGHLGLGKIITIYDRNEISIEGSTDLAFTEDIVQRFEAYHWQVLQIQDGNDIDRLASALNFAKAEKNKPTLIIAHTKIGYGSPLEGSEKTHGAPLGPENTKKTKENLGWDSSLPPFTVPEDVREYLEKVQEEGAQKEAAWQEVYDSWAKENPQLAAELDDLLAGSPKALQGVNEQLKALTQEKPVATRTSSHQILQILAKAHPGLLGGSADLGPSNQTIMDNVPFFDVDNRLGRNIHYGVREFAMAAASNGMALYQGLRPYCATFFVFSDYLKPAIRMSSLMNLPVIYILTHDSIGVGEDGPTHEPIEQLTGLRTIPNIQVFRPANLEETARAWISALHTTDRPTVLVLSRQSLPVLPVEVSYEDFDKGAYIVSDFDKTGAEFQPDQALLLLAAGSEVSLALQVKKDFLATHPDWSVRVISMPSMERFQETIAADPAYLEALLPSSVVHRVSLEAGSTLPWYQWIGLQGLAIGINHFGASAPGPVLFEKYGLTPQAVLAKVSNYIK